MSFRSDSESCGVPWRTAGKPLRVGNLGVVDCGDRSTAILRGASLAAVGASLALAFAAQAQMTFVEVGSTRGFSAYAQAPLMGGGVAAADVDADGDVDLFLPTDQGTPDRYYRNLGDGTFEEVAAEVGLASTLRARTALWFDGDGDTDLDLLVAGDCYGTQIACEPGISLLRYYEQGADGLFTEQTEAAGFTDDAANYLVNQHRAGLAAADLDGDLDVDVYASWWNGRSLVFRNEGDGTFQEIGATTDLGADHRSHWQPLIFDVDRDGRLDLFVAIDFDSNELWRNRGDWNFLDVAATAGVDTAYNEMGAALGDIDGNGRLDLYVTNITGLEEGRHNVLFRRRPAELAFDEVAEAAGVADTGWGWGTTFADLDQDGDVDLGATNGFTFNQYVDDASRLFENRGLPGAPRFDDVSESAGFDDTLWGNTLIAADLDRDGDLDLVQTAKEHGGPTTGTGYVRWLENRTPAVGAWLQVVPRRHDGNYHALGTLVEAQVGDQTQVRLITAGTSFLGQEPAEAHFGLGEVDTIDALTLRWPGDGGYKITRIAPLQTDQRVTVLFEQIFADGFESGDLRAWTQSTP